MILHKIHLLLNIQTKKMLKLIGLVIQQKLNSKKLMDLTLSHLVLESLNMELIQIHGMESSSISMPVLNIPLMELDKTLKCIPSIILT